LSAGSCKKSVSLNELDGHFFSAPFIFGSRLDRIFSPDCGHGSLCLNALTQQATGDRFDTEH
jgi:hypothetical protein